MPRSNPIPTLELTRGLASSLAQGHRWVYRDHVPRGFTAADGAWVHIRAGAWRGYGLWDAASSVALRIYSEREVPDQAWIDDRVTEALHSRASLRAAGVSAYRWINGEGDGLPGIVVDRYGPVAVMVAHVASVGPLLAPVGAALRQQADLQAIVLRRPIADQPAQVVWGKLPRKLVVDEHGMRLLVDPLRGQKTGLFLDHRENRAFIRRLAVGGRVLNLFSYTGGFSIAAALGGAQHVASVDIAQAALDAAQDNFRFNGVRPADHSFVAADVFQFLHAQRDQMSDLVISDPPSFARNSQQRTQALKAYKKLHVQALRLVKPGGMIAVASCTAQVGLDEFRGTLVEAATRVRRRVQILHEAGLPLDHPVMAGHPQGRYLKFLVGRVFTAP